MELQMFQSIKRMNVGVKRIYKFNKLVYTVYHRAAFLKARSHRAFDIAMLFQARNGDENLPHILAALKAVFVSRQI